MGYLKACILLISILLICAPTEARPVSYPDGWTLMSQNNWEKNRLHLHYSPTKEYSVGVVGEYLRDAKRKVVNFQLNQLLLRKNTDISQANLYLKSQYGLATEDDKTEANLELNLSGDWETRRYFTSFDIGGSHTGKLDPASSHQKIRLGLAPYLANYGSLHTWLMVQAENHPQQDKDKFRLTPILRFFKGDYLAEFGVDLDGEGIFNFIIRR